MAQSILIHDYFIKKLNAIVDEWYETLDTTDNGVYSSSDPESVQQLKIQAMSFHVQFCRVFIIDKNTFELEMADWINMITADEAHLNTKNPSKIKEFLRTQKQYLHILHEFSIDHADEMEADEVQQYTDIILDTMQDVIFRVTSAFEINQEKLLTAQNNMISELSAPVILLTKETGLLPLVGEIDSYRSSKVFSKVMETCSQKQLSYLLIDLSGVAVIDTMVAKELFMLIDGLTILGIEAYLTGIRPEIAQTAIQLGINLNRTNVFSDINRAIQVKHLI